MEDTLTNILQTGNPTAIIAAVVVYLIIAYQRKETGQKRDQDSNMVDYRLTRLESDGTELSKAIKELQESIISLTVTVNRMMAQEEMKNAKRDPNDPVAIFWLTVVIGVTFLLVEFFTRPKL